MEEAEKLINEISECNRKLVKLQSSCIHTKKELKFINLSQGVRWVCKECKSLLGLVNPILLDGLISRSHTLVWEPFISIPFVYSHFLLYLFLWSTITYSTLSFFPQCGQCNFSNLSASLTFHSSLHFLLEHL